jgi:hypothetical protein
MESEDSKKLKVSPSKLKVPPIISLASILAKDAHSSMLMSVNDDEI